MRLINLSGFETIQKNVTATGTPQRLSQEYVAITISFANTSGTPPTAAANDTISDSDSLFVANGFKAGDIITVSGSTSNDGEYEIETVTAGTITLTKSGILTTEIAGDTVTVTAKKGIKVEDGVAVVIKAKATNTGTISLANTSAKALNSNTSYFSNYRITAGQSIALQVKNLDSVWIDATVSGEGVEVLFEK